MLNLQIINNRNNKNNSENSLSWPGYSRLLPQPRSSGEAILEPAEDVDTAAPSDDSRRTGTYESARPVIIPPRAQRIFILAKILIPHFQN